MAAPRLSSKKLVRQASNMWAATGDGAFDFLDRNVRWTVTKVRAFGPDTPWPSATPRRRSHGRAAAILAGALTLADCCL